MESDVIFFTISKAGFYNCRWILVTINLKAYAETMREYDVQHLLIRRKEHMLMNMFTNKNNQEYVDMNRPDRLLRNHDGTKFKIRATRNQKVFKSPYYRGVQLWE